MCVIHVISNHYQSSIYSGEKGDNDWPSEGGDQGGGGAEGEGEDEARGAQEVRVPGQGARATERTHQLSKPGLSGFEPPYDKYYGL